MWFDLRLRPNALTFDSQGIELSDFAPIPVA